MANIEERLRRLEDKEAILETLHTYGHAIDYGYEDEFVDCWVADGVLDWPRRPAPFKGHEAIRGAFRAHTHAPNAYHKHFMVEPRIRIDGDRAEVQSLYARLDRFGGVPQVRGFGRYLDTMVRCPDGLWRFTYRKAESEASYTAQ